MRSVSLPQKAAYEWGPIQLVAKATGLSSLCRDAIKEYSSFIENLDRNNGQVTRVKILKDLHSRCKLACLGVTNKEAFGGKWLSLTSKGLPKKLPSLSLLLEKGDWGCRIATSITSTVETMRLPPSVNVDSIIEPSSADRCSLVYWTQWCEDYSKRHWSKHLHIDQESKMHTSFSAGPNGSPSLVTSAFDSLLLMKDPHFDQYLKWCDTFKRYDLQDMLVGTSEALKSLSFTNKAIRKITSKESKLVLAKLLFLADKAGKTRVVYCLSWWLQELLHPLHRGLYKLLYSIKEDGTKSHSEAASIVRNWTKEGRTVWSIDLTNATDRFPKELQEAVIRGLLGADKAKTWSEIMGINPYVPELGKYVKYEVGQPMGAKTSWAIFALTHHTVLRIICSSCGAKENPYVIIGDDIVISNAIVANKYIGLLNDLGVPYSKGKTILPSKEGESSVAEFAKRIFRNGVELSPLTSSLVERVWKHKDFPVFLSVLKEIEVKWGTGCSVTTENLHFLPPVNLLFQSIPMQWRNKLAESIGSSMGPGASNDGNQVDLTCDHLTVPNPWAGIGQLTWLSHLGEVTFNRLQHYTDLLTKVSDKLKLKGPLKEIGATRTILTIESSPLKMVVNHLDVVLNKVYNSIANGDLNLDKVLELGLDLDYLEALVSSGRSWKSHKRLLERRDKQSLKFWHEVHQLCVSPQKPLTQADIWEEW